jgi:hypothetical protein
MISRCAAAPQANAGAGTNASQALAAATMNVFRMLIY